MNKHQYDLIKGQSWMEVGHNKVKYDYIAEKVYESAKNLLDKKLIPDQYKMYFTDPNMLEAAIEETFRGPFREWSCHECGIMVYGPKRWLHFHLPYHGKFQKREGREHEIWQMKFGLY